MHQNKENKGTIAAAEQKEPAANNEKDDLAKQLGDYKDSLQRLQAEFENYKKRVDNDKAQFRQFAVAGVIEILASTADNGSQPLFSPR